MLLYLSKLILPKRLRLNQSQGHRKRRVADASKTIYPDPHSPYCVMKALISGQWASKSQENIHNFLWHSNISFGWWSQEHVLFNTTKDIQKHWENQSHTTSILSLFPSPARVLMLPLHIHIDIHWPRSSEPFSSPVRVLMLPLLSGRQMACAGIISHIVCVGNIKVLTELFVGFTLNTFWGKYLGYFVCFNVFLVIFVWPRRGVVS